MNAWITIQHTKVLAADPMDCSTRGFPVPHHLPELAQVHAHCIGDGIQPSHHWNITQPWKGETLGHLLPCRWTQKGTLSDGIIWCKGSRGELQALPQCGMPSEPGSPPHELPVWGELIKMQVTCFYIWFSFPKIQTQFDIFCCWEVIGPLK